MEITFLGGASGVGASCLFIAIGNHHILIDAGVRMDARGDRLPDLAALDGVSLDAIFVTHAHADHIGALPLVHAAFPHVPIYTSRATMRLMEVMLTDALHVMARRAAEELEVPLYDEQLVASMLRRLRVLPLNGTITLTELPGVTVHTARAGHVAGAVSLGFAAPDGSLVVSGDVSVTPQHTVLGAAMPALQHPDLMVLESTYGSRLHPNRQIEEERLAQTVAEGIARGGHVLIPAFALGRAQEVLRILYSAQRAGRVPAFPIRVDGLVRTVCATYTAIPEALTPQLARQIRRGYHPFFGGVVRPVADPQERERIIAGEPACIVASSGMLTGGPSAWYAARLAPRENAAILITGYQDEEAPGKKLLALAEAGGGDLTLGGQTLALRCRIERYHLSAHADGGELAGLVAALHPGMVALVHGDSDARAALGQRLEQQTAVVLPRDGHTLRGPWRSAGAKNKRRGGESQSVSADTSPVAIGGGTSLDAAGLERLWVALSNAAAESVSVRELAHAWYGATGEAEEASVAALLNGQQFFFVPLVDIPGVYRLRSVVADEAEQSTPPSLVGQMVMLQTMAEQVLPAVVLEAWSGSLTAVLPQGEGPRSRFPLTAVREVVGPWPEARDNRSEVARSLADLVKATRRWRWQYGAQRLAAALEDGVAYDLGQLTTLAGVAADDLAGRLAVALSVTRYHELFVRSENNSVSYTRHPDWEQAVAAGVGIVRPDQSWILSAVDQHLGQPPDLYRRSVDADTGAVSLYFHFPSVARTRYAAALEALKAESGVEVLVVPQAHQGALTDAARAVLPPDLTVLRTPALYHDRQTVVVRVAGNAPPEALAEAAARFADETGWRLEIENAAGPSVEAWQGPVSAIRMEVNAAIALARAMLAPTTGCYKVGADQARGALVLRFYFPDVARVRVVNELAAIAARTGWQVSIYDEPHHAALIDQVRQVLPTDLSLVGQPSLWREVRTLSAIYRGEADSEVLAAAEDAFAETTGWTLVLRRG